MAKAKTTTTKTKGPAPVLPAVLAAPPGNAPAAPTNFQRLTRAQVSSLHKATKGTAFSAVAAEIAASSSYVADFGPKASPPATMQAELHTAALWDEEAKRAQLWADFAHEQSLLASNQIVGGIVTTFKKDFAAAVHHDPTIPARWPALSALIGARAGFAQKGVATRAAKKKAAAKPPAPPKAGA